MLNSRRSFKNNNYNGSKSRSKSLYRGDQSHTLSMHIQIDNEVSPDRTCISPDPLLKHKNLQKENRIQGFRDSIKMNQSGTIGKRSERSDLNSRSTKKITAITSLETERPDKLISSNTYRKPAQKQDRFEFKDISTRQEINITVVEKLDTIGINSDDLKATFAFIKKISHQNAKLRKELRILSRKQGSTVAMALRL